MIRAASIRAECATGPSTMCKRWSMGKPPWHWPSSFANELGQCQGGFPIDQRLHIVEGPVAHSARIDAARIIRTMLGRIPAADCYVEPAAKGDGIIDDDKLLVVRRAD